MHRTSLLSKFSRITGLQTDDFDNLLLINMDEAGDEQRGDLTIRKAMASEWLNGRE